MASKSDTSENSYLIAEFLNGNWDCYEKLVLKYFDWAFAYTIRFTKSKEVTEGIIEKACLKIWDDRLNLDNEIDFSAYLRLVLGELVLDHLHEVSKSKKLQDALWKKISKSVDQREPLYEYDQDHIKSLLHRYHKAQLLYKLTTEPS